jgi:hypothetical protein
MANEAQIRIKVVNILEKATVVAFLETIWPLVNDEVQLRFQAQLLEGLEYVAARVGLAS